MNFRFIILGLIIIFFNNNNAFSQKSVVLIQGNVKNEEGNPVGTTMMFSSSLDKHIQCKSNLNDGSYQQVINSGEQYSVVFKEYLLVKPKEYLSTFSINKYTELTRNFVVREMKEGQELYRLNPFEPNSAKINNASASPLLELSHFLFLNPKVNVQIEVSASDSKLKSSKKKVEVQSKKGQKSLKTFPSSSKSQLQDLINARTNALKVYLQSIRIHVKHMSFTQNLKPSQIQKKFKKGKSENPDPPVPTVVVRIERILNF
jgi:hypothetical protein